MKCLQAPHNEVGCVDAFKARHADAHDNDVRCVRRTRRQCPVTVDGLADDVEAATVERTPATHPSHPPLWTVLCTFDPVVTRRHPWVCWTGLDGCATIVAVSVEPLRSVRDHLSEVVERVEKQHERVTITRNGRAAAVLISPEDLAELEETLSVLADPAALADIREADLGYRAGDVVRGVEAVRRLKR